MSSLYEDPRDQDELPEYPPHDARRAGAAAPLEQLGGSDSKGGDKGLLVKGGRREGEPIPLEIDGFAYEVRRCPSLSSSTSPS